MGSEMCIRDSLGALKVVQIPNPSRQLGVPQKLRRDVFPSRDHVRVIVRSRRHRARPPSRPAFPSSASSPRARPRARSRRRARRRPHLAHSPERPNVRTSARERTNDATRRDATRRDATASDFHRTSQTLNRSQSIDRNHTPVRPPRAFDRSIASSPTARSLARSLALVRRPLARSRPAPSHRPAVPSPRPSEARHRGIDRSGTR